MRWTRGNRENIDDLRGQRAGFGGRGMPIGIGGLLLLLALSWFTGADFLSLLGGGGAPSQSTGTTGDAGPVAASPQEEELVDMVDAVMGDLQNTWSRLCPAVISGRRSGSFTAL